MGESFLRGLNSDTGNWYPIRVSTDGELYIYSTRLQAGENQSLDTQGVSIKHVASSTYCPSTLDTSTTNEASSVTKSSAGVLLGAYGTIISGTASGAYYLQFFNATAVPADTTAPYIMAFTINHTTGTPTSFFFDISKVTANTGIYFSTGICWCFSSTLYTKTITGSIGGCQIIAV